MLILTSLSWGGWVEARHKAAAGKVLCHASTRLKGLAELLPKEERHFFRGAQFFCFSSH